MTPLNKIHSRYPVPPAVLASLYQGMIAPSFGERYLFPMVTQAKAKLVAIVHCRIPTIFITAHGDAQMRMQALRAGAAEFLAKPFDDEVLLENVRAALES